MTAEFGTYTTKNNFNLLYLQYIQIFRWAFGVLCPLLTILTLSMLIICKILQSKRIQKQRHINHAAGQYQGIKVTTNIISLVVTYIILLVPGFAVNFIFTYFPYVFQNGLAHQTVDYIIKYTFVARILNCSVNCFVFLALSRRFRNVAYNVVRCKC